MTGEQGQAEKGGAQPDRPCGAVTAGKARRLRRSRRGCAPYPGPCTYLPKERMQTMFQNKWFYLFCISMLPIVELRGGIPAGAAMGLPFWSVYLTCVLGNLLPVPFLILFAKKILEFLSTLPRIGGFFQKIIRRADQKAAEIGHYEKWGLFLFVAIPLPGTGAWTGSLVAAVLRMRIWQAFLVITAGVLVSGFITGGIVYGLFTALA